MLILSSYIHRQRFSDILERWLVDRPEPQDARALKRIVNFNSYLVGLYLSDLCRELFGRIRGPGVERFEVGRKAGLKDFIVLEPPATNRRIEEIRARYARHPQEYYRSAPFHGVIYHTGTRREPTYVGHSRIKRTRRIAEKGSRRIIDHMFNRIKTQADILAAERASRMGIPKSMLVTDPQTQLREFVEAEDRVIRAIRRGTLVTGTEDRLSLVINDIAGIKVILEDDRAHLLYDAVERIPGLEIVEIEKHEGNYNATNLILRLTLDVERLASRPPSGRARSILVSRAMDADDIEEGWRGFVTGGEPDIHLEVILSSYAEMIESELGRSMHEERILDQRSRQEYRSPLAVNVRYLIEYLFLFTMSPTSHVDEIPIKLWEKSMPDSFDEAVKALWHMETLPALPEDGDG